MTSILVTPLMLPQQGSTRLELGQKIPTYSGGTARWEAINRPRRRPLLDFKGEDLLKLNLTVMLDQFPDGDVEPLIGRIMGWAARMNLPVEPSPMRLEGPLVYAWVPYVLTGVDHIEDNVAFNDQGKRCRQELGLEFTEYVPVDPSFLPAAPAEAARARQQATPTSWKLRQLNGAAPQSRTHTVQRGDTLWKIAAQYLGNGARYREIADLNGLRDPNVIKVGQVLKVPAS